MFGPNQRDKTHFVGLIVALIAVALMLSGFVVKRVLNFAFQGNQTQTTTIQKAKPTANVHYSNVPSPQDANQAYANVQNQLKTTGTYNGHGAFILNNNHATLAISRTQRPYAANTTISNHRPGVANAFLTKASRQYKNRAETNNGRTDWVPIGWHQMTNLPGQYKYAYNRGHLLGYALVGNVKGFDASESNHKNIITETAWANQAGTANNTGQNYYEGLVRKALDHNKKVRYQVKPIYAQPDDAVPMGVQMQALSTDHSLDFNVFVPNIQGNININYHLGTVTLKNN